MKPWYRRKRWWAVAIVLLLVYFCLVPSPLRISPETTGYTEPLTPNGDVDYFGVYEKTYIDKLSPPEDNGQRLMIAACGPRILEQAHMMETVPWEELPTNEISKNWFENRWTPLCEHMGIDPYAKPRFHDSLDFYSFMHKTWETNKKTDERLRDRQKDEQLWDKLVAAPWKAEEHPDVADWVKERSPVLDLFGVAVRKPNFVCWRWREKTIYSILLPDVQAQRSFGRDLRVRVTERLGRGDVDGAWYDVMSMFHLGRHYMNDPIFVVNTVGIAVEGQAWEAAKIIFRNKKLSSEQWERFAADLKALPCKRVLGTSFEDMLPAAILRGLKPGVFKDLYISDETPRRNLLYVLSFLPVDLNIAGKRFVELNTLEFRATGDLGWNINSVLLKKNTGLRDSFVANITKELNSPFAWLRIPLIRTRSRLVADCLIELYANSLLGIQTGFDRVNAQHELLRIAVALERYKAAHEKYPETLFELVPAYLEEVPLDPFTGRQTLVYKPEGKDGKPFTLYSLGPNGKDDGGKPPAHPVRSENWADCDIVF